MESKEKARKDLISLMDQEALKAKQNLDTKETTISAKREKNEISLERKRSRCHEMFETQKRNYDRYTELSDRKLQHHSELVMTKYNTVQKKSKMLNERTNEQVLDHREKNFERFATKSVNFDRREAERLQFLRNEDKRHQSRVKTREAILNTLNSEHERKRELNKLRVVDARENQEMIRVKKQENQDFFLKKQFLNNSFMQEASRETSR